MRVERWVALIVFVFLASLAISAILDGTPAVIGFLIFCLFVAGCIFTTIAYFFYRRKRSQLRSLLLWLFGVLGYNCLSQTIYVYIDRLAPFNWKYAGFRAINIIPLAIVAFFLALYLFKDRK